VESREKQTKENNRQNELINGIVFKTFFPGHHGRVLKKNKENKKD
jgi:hypothetical protein